MLKKYELQGVFYKQGIHSFYLLNMEATLYLLLISIITYLVVRIISKFYVRLPNTNKIDADKDLSIIQKTLIKKKEGFEWDGFAR